MNGRLYDPFTGQFLSPDNYVQAPDFTQNLNRYVYCLNNPLKYTDPSGFTLEDLMHQSYYGSYNSWIQGQGPIIQSGGYRSSRVMTQSDFDKMWNSTYGGRWDENSGSTYFSSYAEGVFYGCIYNEYHNSWGSTHAGSFRGALATYKNIKSNGGIGGATSAGGSDLLASLDGAGASGGGTFPSFSILWSNYPHDINGEHQHPSSDSYAKNQCAIRLGLCLILSGIDMSSYPRSNVTSEGYPRSTKGLADWLWQEYGRPTIMSQSSFESNYWINTGIIYIAPPYGGIGHIDLFNKGTIGSGYYLGSEIWFWDIK